MHPFHHSFLDEKAQTSYEQPSTKITIISYGTMGVRPVEVAMCLATGAIDLQTYFKELIESTVREGECMAQHFWQAI